MGVGAGEGVGAGHGSNPATELGWWEASWLPCSMRQG
jgi:hypothetical protein